MQTTQLTQHLSQFRASDRIIRIIRQPGLTSWSTRLLKCVKDKQSTCRSMCANSKKEADVLGSMEACTRQTHLSPSKPQLGLQINRAATALPSTRGMTWLAATAPERMSRPLLLRSVARMVTWKEREVPVWQLGQMPNAV